MTITLDVPEDLERQPQMVPHEEVARFALVAIRQEFETLSDADAFLPLSDDDHVAIERGFADVEYGNVYDVEVAFEKLQCERASKH